MHRLVYCSSNKILGSREQIRAQIEQILAVSRKNNRRVQLTGALMFSSGCFGQVLEGHQDAIEATFERIQQDHRHGNVTVLDFAEVEGRVFGDWAMAHVGAAASQFSDWRNDDFDIDAVNGEMLLKKLAELVSKGSLVA